ncbi:hypothetical protein L9F63_012730, partial [Diploptera punctata]
EHITNDEAFDKTETLFFLYVTSYLLNLVGQYGRSIWIIYFQPLEFNIVEPCGHRMFFVSKIIITSNLSKRLCFSEKNSTRCENSLEKLICGDFSHYEQEEAKLSILNENNRDHDTYLTHENHFT